MTNDIFNVLAFDRNILAWVVILIVALLVFGNRLPGIAKSLGKSMGEFKKGLNDTSDEKDQTKPADKT